VKLAGFLKVRNEIIREGNLYRVLAQLETICDGGVICDDASTDGTREHLDAWVDEHPCWELLCVTPAEQAFRNEMQVKQRMLQALGAWPKGHWDWVLWMDGDELFEPAALERFRPWLEANGKQADVWSFHYTQLWRAGNWARTDSGFDDGAFWKLWCWSDDLAFEVGEGELHAAQFPKQYIPDAVAAASCGGNYGRARRAPFEIIHLGNYAKNLIWKAIQYRNSGVHERASLARHLYFRNCSFRRVSLLAGLIEKEEPPVSFTDREVKLIEQMADLKGRPGLFVVIVPTYNRGYALDRTLGSVLRQSWDNWVCVVLDDGSTDDTPHIVRRWTEYDPRFFYCRYEQNRGGVAMNEIGCALACEFGEFWVRLGSDDYFEPHKLELDAVAFEHGANFVYGPYRDLHETFLGDIAVLSMPQDARGILLSRGFAASWANVAVRVELLKAVRERYGAFVDASSLRFGAKPGESIRNMEDLLLNNRLAHLTETTWRGLVRLGPSAGEIIIGARDISEVTNDRNKLVHDAVWRIGADGASAKSTQIEIDSRLTHQQLDDDYAEFPPPTPRQPATIVRVPWKRAIPAVGTPAGFTPPNFALTAQGAPQEELHTDKGEGPLPRRRVSNVERPPKREPEWSIRQKR